MNGNSFSKSHENGHRRNGFSGCDQNPNNLPLKIEHLVKTASVACQTCSELDISLFDEKTILKLLRYNPKLKSGQFSKVVEKSSKM